MAAACALAIFSGKNILYFGTAERLRAFRYPIFTREKGPRSQDRYAKLGSKKQEPPPWPVTVLSF